MLFHIPHLQSLRPFCTIWSGLVEFSHSVVSNSLRPHEPQHARPLCPSPTARVYPNPCPLSRWCHPTISSSVVLFSSCPQSFPASGSFPVSQLLTSGCQSIGASISDSPYQASNPNETKWKETRDNQSFYICRFSICGGKICFKDLILFSLI